MRNSTTLKRAGILLSVALIGTECLFAGNIMKQRPLEDIKHLSSLNTPTRADEEYPGAPVLTDIISEVDGVNENYVRYGSGYFPMMGGIYYYTEETEPSPSVIVFGEDNKVYFRDLMDFTWDSYVEGTISENKITVKLPQTLFKEEYTWTENPYYHNLCVMTQKGEGTSLNFTCDEEITEVTYTIDENNKITLDPLPEGKALGIMTYFIGKIYDSEEDEIQENDNYTLGWLDYWSGAADFTQIFNPLGMEKVAWPEGLEPVEYQVVINGYNYPVKVGFKDNYMYIQGLGDSSYVDNFVIRADVDGNKVSIPQNQYIGVFSWDNEMVVTKCGYQDGNSIKFSSDDVSFDFEMATDRQTLIPVDPEMYLCFAYMLQQDSSTGQNGLVYTFYFNNFAIVHQDSYPGVPMNPRNLRYDTSNYKDSGFNSIHFEILSWSTDKNVILTGNLYYSIYLDGELIVFEYEPGTEVGEYSKYFMLPEPTSEVPFLFTNDYEFYIWDEIEREVGFYYDGVTTVGVQAIYYCGEERTCSDIVTLNVDTDEVTNIPADAGVQILPDNGSEILSVQYYDLNGRKVSHPQNGIFVKKSTLANGRTVTNKVAVK